jgi:ABC-2 family transporter protein
MTALTVPARPEEDADLRPVPWRRMAWVTWRQHRVALAGVAALLGALAVYVWIAGLQMHHAYATATACHPATSPACGNLFLTADQMNTVLASGYALLALPALIGAFVGAPLLAREMETGTFRYAWTQGFGRRRWTLAKLVALAVVVAAAAGALSVLLSWYYQPYFAARNPALSFSEVSPLTPGLFDLRGITFAAWTLAAFAIGGLAGMLIRRVVPAIAATLAAYAGLAVATGMFLRQHYLTPLVTSKLNAPVAAWITSQWLTKDGSRSPAHGDQAINLFRHLCPASALGAPGPTAKPPLSPVQCFAQHGYTQWTSYQPASRFWPFQWIEGGWLLALSVLLITATVWLVRRRAA